MADFRYKDPSGGRTNVIDDGTSLTDGTRAAGDYDNSTALDFWCIPFLTVQFDGGPPATLVEVAKLYVIPGDAAGTELYAEGGDAGLGTNDDPQEIFFVGTFVTINPSTSVDETLSLPPFLLYPHGNRFVFKNISGQTMDLTWQLDILVYKTQSN